MDTFILLPIEVINIISHYGHFFDKIRLKSVNKYLYSVVKITDLYDIDDNLLNKLDDNILINYCHVLKLNAKDNPNITNVNHMIYLQKLNASNGNCFKCGFHCGRDCNLQCGISDDSIKDLNLIELNANFNPNIINIGHMNKLQILHSCCNCGIGDSSTQKLNLIKLYLGNNPKITSVRHMNKLEVLCATGFDCNIDDDDIKELNLIQLDVSNNYKITNLNHMDKLETLRAKYGSCGIGDDGIKNLKLQFVNAGRNPKITNIYYTRILNQLKTSQDNLVPVAVKN